MTTTVKKISEERVWMKYYPEEAQNVTPPKMKAFDFVMELSQCF
jgi:hypothetical protein